MTYPDGAVVDCVRDALGRIVEIGVTWTGGSREVLIENAVWYPFGPVAGWDYGNGRELSRALDQDYAPVYVEDTAPGGLSLGYAFDDVGRIAALHDASLLGPPQRDYGYDALGRLTSVHDGATSTLLQGYAYDATGNRESATAGATTTPYLYATDSHRLAQVGATARTYDAAGNLTVIGGTTHVMTYAGHGRMATSTRGMQPTTTYAYNGLGEQVHRERGPLQRIALYDESGRWLGDYEGTGTPLQQFVWLDELPVGVLAGAGVSQRLHYVQPDALGTPRVVIDPVRDVAVWRWGLEGEAFGNDVPEQDPDQDGVPFVFDMRFPGQRYDAASGLVQNYYREYEALTGRYTQSDPIGLAGGTSTYGYAEGGPLTSIDPLGLQVVVSPIFLPRPMPLPAPLFRPMPRPAPFPVDTVPPFPAPDDEISERLPRTGACKASEMAACQARCPGRVNGCYVSIKWKVRGIRGGQPVRSEERTVNCNCADDEYFACM